MAESFFASLKVELGDRERYATRAQARASLAGWLAGVLQPRPVALPVSVPCRRWSGNTATESNTSTIW